MFIMLAQVFKLLVEHDGTELFEICLAYNISIILIFCYWIPCAAHLSENNISFS